MPETDFNGNAVEVGDAECKGVGALHDFLEIIKETKSLQMHVHYLSRIGDAISLLVASASSSNG
jgi:hypothetical protein